MSLSQLSFNVISFSSFGEKRYLFGFLLHKHYFSKLKNKIIYTIYTWLGSELKSSFKLKKLQIEIYYQAFLAVLHAFVQGLLRLVTSQAFWTSGKYQALNGDQFTEHFLTEIFIWGCWKWCFRTCNGVSGPSRDPLVVLGFAFRWPLCSQKFQRGALQRLHTLNCINLGTVR